MVSYHFTEERRKVELSMKHSAPAAESSKNDFSKGSIVSAILSLALERTGKHDHSLYDGSWAEWGMYGDLKAVKG